VYIGDENQKACKALITADEFSGLLDRVDRVSARVGKSNDLPDYPRSSATIPPRESLKS
jgi:hypothetical protein